MRMSVVQNKSHSLKQTLLVLIVLAVPVSVGAQHEMESEHGGSSEQSAKAREFAQSIHKTLDCGDCNGEMEMETGRGYLIHVVTKRSSN